MTAFSPKPRRRSRRCCNAEIRGAEYTLTGPLPPTISYQDLQMARADVLSYLEFLTRDLAQGDPERAVTEIQRAADRLKKIASLTPIALAQDVWDQDSGAVMWRAQEFMYRF